MQFAKREYRIVRKEEDLVEYLSSGWTLVDKWKDFTKKTNITSSFHYAFLIWRMRYEDAD